jgi:hypothetical protein
MELITTPAKRERENTNRLIIVDVVISQNLELLRQVCDNSRKQASYGFFEIGIKTAFHYLNSLLPANFRKGLTYSECCCLNEKILEILRDSL